MNDIPEGAPLPPPGLPEQPLDTMPEPGDGTTLQAPTLEVDDNDEEQKRIAGILRELRESGMSYENVVTQIMQATKVNPHLADTQPSDTTKEEMEAKTRESLSIRYEDTQQNPRATREEETIVDSKDEVEEEITELIREFSTNLPGNKQEFKKQADILAGRIQRLRESQRSTPISGLDKDRED